MFSTKIYVLSVFVFSLFNLGQAAPIADEISSLSTRELTSLDARGFLDDLFGKKLDKATQEQVNNVSLDGNCHLHNIYTTLEQGHKAAQTAMTAKIGDVVPKKKLTPVQAEYKKRAKEFGASAKKVQQKLDALTKKFGKLGVKPEDIATKCASPSSNSHSAEKTLVETPHPQAGPAEPTESHPSESHPEQPPQPPTSN